MTAGHSLPPRLDDLPDLLTVEEYARWARRGRNRAYEDVRLGVVPSVRLGRVVRIPKAALARFLAAASESAADQGATPAGPPVPLHRRAAR